MADTIFRLTNGGEIFSEGVTKAQVQAEIAAAVVRGDDFINFNGIYSINNAQVDSGDLLIAMENILLINPV